MRKGNIVATILALGVAMLLNVEPVLNIRYCVQSYQNKVKESDKITQMLSSIDDELSQYKEKYKDFKICTNTDIAQTISKLDGCKFKSVTSVVDLGGQLINCAEVTSPKDVAFFSTQTKYMKFKLEVTDFHIFCDQLKSSAIAVKNMQYDAKNKLVTLEVTTMFENGDDELLKGAKK